MPSSGQTKALIRPRANGSEPKFPVRRLPSPLALWKSCFLGGEVDGRGRENFVDVAAHDAATVCAVPVALDDDRAAALRTGCWRCLLESGHIWFFLHTVLSTCAGHMTTRRLTDRHRPSVLTRLAVGFGRKVALSVVGETAEFTPRVWVPRCAIAH